METNFWKKYKDLILLFTITICVIFLVALFFFRTSVFVKAFRAISSILAPFIYGFVIAYLLRPVSIRLERLLLRIGKNSSGKRRGLARTVSIILSLLLLLAAITALLLLVLPQIVSSISRIISRLPAAIDSFQAWLTGLDSGDEASHELVSTINQITETVSQKVQSFLQTSLLPTLQTAITRVTSSFMGILGVLKDFGLGCIISVYYLTSWEKFGMQARMLVYSSMSRKSADIVMEETHFINRMFSGFIIGKLVDSAIIGVICFLFTELFNFPYAMLISVIVGVTNIIPFFGPYLGAIPSILLLMTESFPKAIVFLVFIIVLQQVDGNIIGPKILGDRLGISSFWILFSILFFGALWGLVGMLVGAPIFAVLYDLIKKRTRRGLKARGCEELADQYREAFKQ